MALSKIGSDAIVNDAIGPNQLDETANYTFTGTVAGAGGVNTPAFRASRNVTQNTTDFVQTKVNYPDIVFDTASSYNTSTSTYTIPSGQGGKYFVYACVRCNGDIDSEVFDLAIRVNNSYAIGYSANQYRYTSNYVAGVLNLSAGDALTVYVFLGNNIVLRDESGANYFGAYKIIE